MTAPTVVVGEVVGMDFESDTMTLKLAPGYRVTLSGRVEVVPAGTTARLATLIEAVGDARARVMGVMSGTRFTARLHQVWEAFDEAIAPAEEVPRG